MSLEFYKILHLLGLMTLFFSFGGALILGYAGVPFQGRSKTMIMMLHGIALLLILITGFGMAAKMGYMSHLPGWIQGKLAIWVLLAGGIVLVKRKGSIGWPLVILILGLGTTAAILAVTKPF
jgi:hypothetical protein